MAKSNWPTQPSSRSSESGLLVDGAWRSCFIWLQEILSDLLPIWASSRIFDHSENLDFFLISLTGLSHLPTRLNILSFYWKLKFKTITQALIEFQTKFSPIFWGNFQNLNLAPFLIFDFFQFIWLLGIRLSPEWSQFVQYYIPRITMPISLIKISELRCKSNSKFSPC